MNISVLAQPFMASIAPLSVGVPGRDMNSKFRYRMYAYNGKDDAEDASKRMINWNAQHWTPLVFTEKDFEAIKANKNCFFARKFYANVDMAIVAKLEDYLSSQK